MDQAAIFAELIANHARLSDVPIPPKQTQANACRNLLDVFVPIYEASVRDEAKGAAATQTKLEAFIHDYWVAVDKWRKHQVDTADEFSILEVLDLTHQEIRHSMMLAWLLDWDMLNYGTHAQDNLGFRLFLTVFEEVLKLPLKLAEARYRVRREVPGNTSRIDIEVFAQGQFLIHIENKIWSKEGWHQTQREGEGMKSRATALEVPAGHVVGLFLTPDGQRPENPDFRPISWRQVAEVVERFAMEARPPDVQLFARHYARTLRRFIIQESQVEDADRGQDTL